MNKVVRNKMFETNSSSSHSITIVEGEFAIDRLPVLNNGIIQIYGGEFGWEFEDYYDSITKASYCLTYAKNRPDLIEQLKRVVLSVHPEAKEAVCIIDNNDYIDHQSQDVASEAFESDELLKAFIFNKKSELHTGNDNV